MDPLAAHRARVGHLRESFAEANERLVARLRGVDDEAGRHVPGDGGWSAAQIGWHVARVTTRFAGIMSGELPGAQPVAADFVERPWAEIAPTVADRLEAPPSVQPPPGVARMEAISALEASGMKMARALDAVAMSPWTPPAIFIFSAGDPVISTESNDSGAPRYASMCSVITGAPLR